MSSLICFIVPHFLSFFPSLIHLLCLYHATFHIMVHTPHISIGNPDFKSFLFCSKKFSRWESTLIPDLRFLNSADIYNGSMMAAGSLRSLGFPDLQQLTEGTYSHTPTLPKGPYHRGLLSTPSFLQVSFLETPPTGNSKQSSCSSRKTRNSKFSLDETRDS